MEKIVRKFDNFEAAEAAEAAFYGALSGDQRLEILLDLIMPEDPNEAVIERSARVYPLTREPRC